MPATSPGGAAEVDGTKGVGEGGAGQDSEIFWRLSTLPGGWTDPEKPLTPFPRVPEL